MRGVKGMKMRNKMNVQNKEGNGKGKKEIYEGKQVKIENRKYQSIIKRPSPIPNYPIAWEDLLF